MPVMMHCAQFIPTEMFKLLFELFVAVISRLFYSRGLAAVKLLMLKVLCVCGTATVYK